MDGVVVADGSEARRRALVAAIPDLMFRLRRDGTYLEFAGDLSSLATPADSLVGSKVDEILPPDVGERLMGCVAAALETSELRSVEYELHRLVDGDLRAFEARVVPIAADSDEVVAIVRDVTDQYRWTREQASLRRIATLVAAEAGEDTIVAAIANELGKLFDADHANALRWDGDALYVQGEWHRDGRAAAGSRVYVYGGDTISARVLETGTPARVDSAEEFATGFARERWRELGLGASIAAPVRVAGDLWGVVTASRSVGRRPFPEGAEAHLEDFAALLAQAIENARARREMARLLDEQSALRRIATLVAAGRPPAEVLAALSAEVGRLLDARTVDVVRWEGVHNEARSCGSTAGPRRRRAIDRTATSCARRRRTR